MTQLSRRIPSITTWFRKNFKIISINDNGNIDIQACKELLIKEKTKLKNCNRNLKPPIRTLMTKDELITEIRTAFKNVKLEEGVGLWEGQGIDDYADSETILKLRKKDERNNWDNIPYEHLVDCQSSLSFFDAMGMRFCLPKFLIFDILTDEIFKEIGLYSPDVLFILSYKLDEAYQKNRFSLLDNKQIEVVIKYLEYKLTEIVLRHQEVSINYGSTIDTVFSDNEYIELDRTINEWRQKLS